MTTKKRASRPRAAASAESAAEQAGPVATKNVPHPHDPNIWSDGRPKPSKAGNPYAHGTGAWVAWESGIGRAPSGTATTGRRSRPKAAPVAAATPTKTEA